MRLQKCVECGRLDVRYRVFNILGPVLGPVWVVVNRGKKLSYNIRNIETLKRANVSSVHIKVRASVKKLLMLLEKSAAFRTNNKTRSFFHHSVLQARVGNYEVRTLR